MLFRSACRILVPQPGIEPGPLQWKHGFLTTGPPGKSLTGPFSCGRLSPQPPILSNAWHGARYVMATQSMLVETSTPKNMGKGFK